MAQGKGHWVWGNVDQLQRLDVGITGIPSCNETAATGPHKYGNVPPKRDCLQVPQREDTKTNRSSLFSSFIDSQMYPSVPLLFLQCRYNTVQIGFLCPLV